MEQLELEELLRQLVSCRSITPEQGGALDLAEKVLAAAGFVVRRLPAQGVENLWAVDSDCAGSDSLEARVSESDSSASDSFTPDSPRVLFAGHVDVVPPGDLSLWELPPFEGRCRDGFLYGRGATDMKSGVAAMLAAACSLRRAGVSGVAVLLTSDEEGPALFGTRHVAEWMRRGAVQTPVPFAIVGEPTCESEFGDVIKIGRRGSLTARITVRGQQTHVAYPHKGDNPIHRLVGALHDVLHEVSLLQHKSESSADSSDSDSIDSCQLFPPLGAQIVSLQSGVAENVIPSEARAGLNFRYAPHDNADALRRLTESCLQKAAPDHWQCEWVHGAEPFLTAGGKLVDALQQSIFAVCKRRARLSAGGGTSDGRFLRPLCGELAEFGVMSESMHEPNERVCLADVASLAKIYEQTARRLLQTS